MINNSDELFIVYCCRSAAKKSAPAETDKAALENWKQLLKKSEGVLPTMLIDREQWLYKNKYKSAFLYNEDNYIW